MIVSPSLKKYYERMVRHTAAVLENYKSIKAIKLTIEFGEVAYSTGAEAWYELDQQTRLDLYVASSKGGVFTTHERKVIESEEWYDSYHGAGAAAKGREGLVDWAKERRDRMEKEGITDEDIADTDTPQGAGR